MDLLHHSTIAFDDDYKGCLARANSTPLSTSASEEPPRKRPRKQSISELDSSESKEIPYWMRDENDKNITHAQRKKIRKAKKSRAFREKRNEKHYSDDQKIEKLETKVEEMQKKLDEMQKLLLAKDDMIHRLENGGVFWNNESVAPTLEPESVNLDKYEGMEWSTPLDIETGPTQLENLSGLYAIDPVEDPDNGFQDFYSLYPPW